MQTAALQQFKPVELEHRLTVGPTAAASYCPPEVLEKNSDSEAQHPLPELLERPDWLLATGPPYPPLRQFPSLESVTKPSFTTAEAAYYLNRRSQTLRGWACLESGPLRPTRINGRLAWPVSELKRVLGVQA